MTQIIEEVEIHIAPDDWRSVIGMGLKEDWLADKVDEYLAKGGKITTIEPGVTTDIIQEVVSGFNTANSKHRDVVNERRAKQQEAADRAIIPKVDKALDNCYERTMAEVAKSIKTSPGRLRRILALYFPDDPRQDQMSFGRTKTDTELRADAARVQALYDAGMTGWNRLHSAAGISYETMKKLHEKGYLNIPKLPNCCGK